jgi:DNA-binding response OmpR family regulator
MTTTNELCVLVVDDEPSVIRAISSTLRKVLPVRHAGSIADAKALLDEPGILWAAFLFDGELADGSCFTLVEHARQRHPEVPVLVLSGRATRAFQERVIAMGGHYMNKPFELDALRAFVTSAKDARAPK